MELSAAARRGLTAAALLAGVLLAGVAIRALQRDRVEGHAFDIPSGADRIIVEVLNGSGRQGLARLGTRRLRRQGIDVVYFGNAEDALDTTRVLLRRGARDRAERVRAVLGVGRVMAAPDSLRRVDVTVILGPDFQPDEDGRP